MRWVLIERKPGVVYAGKPELYLGKDGAETQDRAQALTFETREAAEAHRRHLPHRYDWVAATSSSG